MIRYVKNGIIKTLEEIRKENLNMSIPPNANLGSIGYEYLKETQPPFVDDTHDAIENGAINNELQWKIVKAVTPKEVSMRQCRLQLLSVDLLDDVDAIVVGDKAYQIEWEYAQTVERTNPLLLALQTQLSLTDEYIDDLFIKASKI